jgi:GT2 family glycosyltransferase
MPALTTTASKFAPATTIRQYDCSVVIVSYNTREVLDRCLRHLKESSEGLSLETIIVDNGSIDGTVQMLEEQHPDIQVIRSEVNLGFGGANNAALSKASGRYIILLNSDAFLQPDALRLAIDHMDDNPDVGLGGGRLIGPTQAWQPSARRFPSLLNDFLSLSGLASRFPRSRFFGRADRTWSDPMKSAEVDWVPGAFSIISSKALEAAGTFDEDFFLYYEEVDLCRRIKALGYKVVYWPDVVVVHLGGESSKKVPQAIMSRSGSQLTLWRLRSEFLYYRKHHRSGARLVYEMERLWHLARQLRNSFGRGCERQAKAAESQAIIELLKRAWKETDGGRISPPRPW